MRDPVYFSGGLLVHRHPDPALPRLPRMHWISTRLRDLTPWIFPWGAVVVAIGVWAELDRGSGRILRAASEFPWAVYAVAVLLAWRFQRSRVVLTVLAIALVDRTLPPRADGYPELVWSAAAVVLPLVIAGVAVLRDQGFFSVGGLAQLSGLLLLPLLLAILLSVSPGDLRPELFAEPLLPPTWTEWSGLSQPSVTAFVVALLTVGVVGLLRGTPVEKALLWAILACALAFREVPGSAESTLYFMAAGGVLGLSVIESSYRLAYHDALTGLPARRALTEALQGIRGEYSVAMVDIDHFKRVNDRHGHEVGDQVLRMVATSLERALQGGRAYRYGGEEFTLVFPGMDGGAAEERAEAVRAAVEEARFTMRGPDRPKEKPDGARRPGKRGRGELKVTVSVGVASGRSKEEDPDEILESADRALYRAKKAGRNRVAS